MRTDNIMKETWYSNQIHRKNTETRKTCLSMAYIWKFHRNIQMLLYSDKNYFVKIIIQIIRVKIIGILQNWFWMQISEINKVKRSWEWCKRPDMVKQDPFFKKGARHDSKIVNFLRFCGTRGLQFTNETEWKVIFLHSPLGWMFLDTNT